MDSMCSCIGQLTGSAMYGSACRKLHPQSMHCSRGTLPTVAWESSPGEQYAQLHRIAGTPPATLGLTQDLPLFCSLHRSHQVFITVSGNLPCGKERCSSAAVMHLRTGNRLRRIAITAKALPSNCGAVTTLKTADASDCSAVRLQHPPSRLQHLTPSSI